MRPVKPVTMWAAVALGQRGEWVNFYTIRHLRRDAKLAYREFLGPERAAVNIEAKRVRFVRVTVAVQEDQ